MNTRAPLALALLMTVSAASAQFTLTDLGAAPAGSNPLSLANISSTSNLDEATFSCSSPLLVHIPFAPCTTQQLRDRESFNGVCPPKSTACADYMKRSLSGANPAGTIAAFTPPPDTKWADPSCTHIPCRLADDKPKTEDPKAETGVNDAIQGPPQMVDMPEGGPEGKMLRYPSGRVEYCFDNSCTKTSGKPMTPSEAKEYLKNEYADQKQLANSLNSGTPTNAGRNFSGMNVNDHPEETTSKDDSTQKSTPNPGGTTPSPSSNRAPNYPGSGGGSSTDDGGGQSTASSDNNPRSIGANFSDDLSRLSSGGTGGGGDSSSSGGGSASTGRGDEVVKVDGRLATEQMNNTGYTYTKIGEAAKNSDALIKGGAAAFGAESGKGRQDVDSTIGDGRYLGKIQAVSNQ